jgi:double-stranded uracil-DNA glycosylase
MHSAMRARTGGPEQPRHKRRAYLPQPVRSKRVRFASAIRPMQAPRVTTFQDRGDRVRPSRADLLASYNATVPDLVSDSLHLLLVGVNPSLWSGWSGYHFGNPTNRLWPVLHAAGLTPRRLHPSETEELLAAGIGITNLVNRATARADELEPDELRAGVARLEATVARYRPGTVAVLGMTAYRTAFGRPRAQVGLQPETIGGRPVWLLPNPSGLNASWQLPRLAAAYAELRDRG